MINDARVNAEVLALIMEFRKRGISISNEHEAIAVLRSYMKKRAVMEVRRKEKELLDGIFRMI